MTLTSRIGAVRLVSTLAVAAAAVVAAPAQAAVIVDIAQVGNDVVATTSGSFNPTGLTSNSGANVSASVNAGLAAFNSVNGNFIGFSGLSGPGTFNSGVNSLTLATTGVGDVFRLFGFNGIVGLPVEYVFGSALNATTTFSGATIQGLNLSPGTYTYTAPNDSIIVRIGLASAVPEPATWALMLLGFGGMGLALRRRRGALAAA